MAGEGSLASEIAEHVGCSLLTVKTWRSRYERDRLGGLRDLPKTTGRPLLFGQDVRARLIALACTRPPDTPEGGASGALDASRARRAGRDVRIAAHEILRGADVRPHLTEFWVMSELGPDFDAQAAAVCGLYLDPPTNAIVVSIDEKTSIAARQPARPDRQPKPGRPARRDSEYIRNGTTNLFAALQVHCGTVAGMTAPTRHQWDFIAFLDQLDTEIAAGQQVIAVLDNLSTHKTQAVQAWLDEHPRWQMVFTPKHASWLNQVEIFFSILMRRLLKHGQFTRPRGPRDADARLRRASQPHRPTVRLDMHRQSARRMKTNN
jgi:hypothetical protein